MKKVGLLTLGCALGLAVCVSPAHALPVFKTAFQKKYNMEAKVVTCDVCHVPGEDKKKSRSDYGKVLEPLIDVEQFKGDNKLAGDEADKVLFDALDKAAKEKAKDGKSYEELIKTGVIPGLKKE
jgi:hypothetical protein